MEMKLIDNLIRRTKMYNDLFYQIAELRMKNSQLMDKYNHQYEIIVSKNYDIDKLTKEISNNKTTARQIVRLTNKTFQDKETKAEIKELCNKIIKGGK